MSDKYLLIEWISVIEQIDSSTLIAFNMDELEKKYRLALLILEDELDN
ncbi:MAG: hypothetical protein ACI35O_16560 [Bacillaceae bacterium]